MSTAARNAAPVREPADDDLEAFDNLADILAWAGVKGNPVVEYTQSGALLVAIAGDEFKTISAAEFASISSEDFEAALAEWKFSQYDDNYEFGTLTATSRQMHLSKDERGQPTAQPGFGRS